MNTARYGKPAGARGAVDMGEVFKVTMILTVICVAITALLAATNEMTAEKIAENSLAAKQNAWREVLPADNYFDIVLSGSDAQNAVFDGLDAAVATRDGSVSGVVITTKDKGYGGEISVLTGFDASGGITGVRLLEHSETAGLGANAAKSKFTDQYITVSGSDIPAQGFAVTKDGGTIDAVTAATISSRAVTRAVNKACAVYKALGEKGYIALPAGYGAPAIAAPAASQSDVPAEPINDGGEDND